LAAIAVVGWDVSLEIDIFVKAVEKRVIIPASSRRRIGRFMMVAAFVDQKAAEKL